MKIIKIENFIYLSIILFLMINFKFFESVYIVFKSSYEQRLIANYGYCEQSSYGFVSYIQKKYNLKKNIKILNEESYPSSQAFIYKPGENFYENKFILLNYNKVKTDIKLNDYFIIEQFKNCYFLEKK